MYICITKLNLKVMDNKQEYILCAAIKRIEGKNCNPYYDGMNDICDIEIGYRHHDILQRFQGEVSRKSKDQGFYTSEGRFVDRYEAMLIAWRAKQVTNEIAGSEKLDLSKIIDRGQIEKLNKLYSEDLY